MKMCKWSLRCYYCGHRSDLGSDLVKSTCPKNTNDKCEVIEKVIVKKGWVDIEIDGTWTANSLGGPVRVFPCEIRIKAKYLRKKK